MTVKGFDDTGAVRVVPGQTTKGQGERPLLLFWFGGSRADLRVCEFLRFRPDLV